MHCTNIKAKRRGHNRINNQKAAHSMNILWTVCTNISNREWVFHLRWNTLKNSCTYDTKYRRIGDIWYKYTRAKKEIYKIEYKLGGTNTSRLCPVSTARFHNMWISSSTNFKFIHFFWKKHGNGSTSTYDKFECSHSVAVLFVLVIRVPSKLWGSCLWSRQANQQPTAFHSALWL